MQRRRLVVSDPSYVHSMAAWLKAAEGVHRSFFFDFSIHFGAQLCFMSDPMLQQTFCCELEFVIRIGM